MGAIFSQIMGGISGIMNATGPLGAGGPGATLHTSDGMTLTRIPAATLPSSFSTLPGYLRALDELPDLSYPHSLIHGHVRTTAPLHGTSEMSYTPTASSILETLTEGDVREVVGVRGSYDDVERIVLARERLVAACDRERDYLPGAATSPAAGTAPLLLSLLILRDQKTLRFFTLLITRSASVYQYCIS